MRHSLLQALAYSSGGPSPISVIWFVLAVVVSIGRQQRWAVSLWIPLFVVSVVGSLPVMMLVFAGGYGLFALPMWGLFPLSGVLLLLCRPQGVSSPARANWVGTWAVALLLLVLFAVPRPDGIDLHLRFVEAGGKPVGNASFPVAIYHSLGGKRDEVLRTGPDGTARLRVYPPEDGAISLIDAKDPRRNIQVRFEPWTPVVGGPVDGYRFDGRIVIAGNSDQEATLDWPGWRAAETIRTEPLFWFRSYANLPDGVEANFNSKNGNWGEAGEWSMRVTPRPGGKPDRPEYVVTVTALNGAAVFEARERFMDEAPIAGYVSRLEFIYPANEQRGPVQFFVRTASGTYAAAVCDFRFWSARQYTNVFVTTYYNPSGSRNLEMDQKKLLNRDKMDRPDFNPPAPP